MFNLKVEHRKEINAVMMYIAAEGDEQVLEDSVYF
jgi:hypothetical protein